MIPVPLAPVWGVVLAGGFGTKTEADWTTFAVDGRPVLESLAHSIRSATDRLLLLVGKKHVVPPAADLFDEVVRDPFARPAGPMACLAEIMLRHPGVAFLAAACDMPGLTRADVEALLASRGAPRLGAVLQTEAGPHALPSLLEPGAMPLLFREMDDGQTSLHRFLLDLGEGQLARIPRDRPLIRLRRPEDSATTVNAAAR